MDALGEKTRRDETHDGENGRPTGPGLLRQIQPQTSTQWHIGSQGPVDASTHTHSCLGLWLGHARRRATANVQTEEYDQGPSPHYKPGSRNKLKLEGRHFGTSGPGLMLEAWAVMEPLGLLGYLGSGASCPPCEGLKKGRRDGWTLEQHKRLGRQRQGEHVL